MHHKLGRFKQFAESLFPHEMEYLLSIQRFEDDEKRKILHLLCDQNQPNEITQYLDIDRRKYSYVMNWCKKQLSEVDVDAIYEQLSHWDNRILTDDLNDEAEKSMMKLFRNADHSNFAFLKLYDLGRNYRHFLQIRLRHREFAIVDKFLTQFSSSYEFARSVNDKLYTITNEIIDQYKKKKGDTKVHEMWLDSVFFDESIDGYNRLLAWIRIVFIAHNYRRINLLKDKFDFFEQLIRSGTFYSRRILANYYSQYLLYHANLNQLEIAIDFGYKSIKEKNSDYLYYVNNLAAILLRAGKEKESLSLLQKTIPSANASTNFHDKIGHTSFLVFALLANHQYKMAFSHATAYFTGFKKEIFEFRWHLFMSAYLRAGLLVDNPKLVLKLIRTYDLLSKDLQYAENPSYSPVIRWIENLAKYMDGQINKTSLIEHQENMMFHPITHEKTAVHIIQDLEALTLKIIAPKG